MNLLESENHACMILRTKRFMNGATIHEQRKSRSDGKHDNATLRMARLNWLNRIC